MHLVDGIHGIEVIVGHESPPAPVKHAQQIPSCQCALQYWDSRPAPTFHRDVYIASRVRPMAYGTDEAHVRPRVSQHLTPIGQSPVQVPPHADPHHGQAPM